jgi:hypothetical protein
MIVGMLGISTLAFASTSASASVARSPGASLQDRAIDWDWCFDRSGYGDVEDYSFFGPLPGSDMPGHGDIWVPIRAYTFFGCDAYVFTLHVRWDYDQSQVANVRAEGYFSNLNIQLDLHMDQLTIWIDPPEGGYQATIDAQGHVTNNFGLSVGEQVGIDFDTYPHINVTVYPNGNYAINSRW